VTRRQLTVFAVFTAAYFLSQFLRHANAVISADVADELSLGAAALGLMTSLFYAAFAAAQLPLGWGLRPVRPPGRHPSVMSAAVIGALVFASAHSFASLAAGRTLMGLGMSGVLMGSFMAFSRWFPPSVSPPCPGCSWGSGPSGGWRPRPARLVQRLPRLAERLRAGGGARSRGGRGHRSVGWLPGGCRGRIEHQEELGLGGCSGAGLLAHRSPQLLHGGRHVAIQSLWAGPFLYDVAGFTTAETGRLITVLSVGQSSATWSAGGWPTASAWCG